MRSSSVPEWDCALLAQTPGGEEAAEAWNASVSENVGTVSGEGSKINYCRLETRNY